jgi:hypothetical protein
MLVLLLCVARDDGVSIRYILLYLYLARGCQEGLSEHTVLAVWWRHTHTKTTIPVSETDEEQSTT